MQKEGCCSTKKHPFDLVIVSDTLLADPDDMEQTLGKPHDSVEAAMMLHRLSGRRHKYGQQLEFNCMANGVTL